MITKLQKDGYPVKYPGAELTPDSLVLRPYPGGVDATIDLRLGAGLVFAPGARFTQRR